MKTGQRECALETMLKLVTIDTSRLQQIMPDFVPISQASSAVVPLHNCTRHWWNVQNPYPLVYQDHAIDDAALRRQILDSSTVHHLHGGGVEQEEKGIGKYGFVVNTNSTTPHCEAQHEKCSKVYWRLATSRRFYVTKITNSFIESDFR